MKSQGQLTDEVRNRVQNQGIYVVEKEVEYDGETIIVYAIMPSKLAEHADDILAQIVPDIYDQEEETEVIEEVPDAPIAEKPKKKVVKPKAPVKKLTKKGKK